MLFTLFISFHCFRGLYKTTQSFPDLLTPFFHFWSDFLLCEESTSPFPCMGVYFPLQKPFEDITCPPTKPAPRWGACAFLFWLSKTSPSRHQTGDLCLAPDLHSTLVFLLSGLFFSVGALVVFHYSGQDLFSHSRMSLCGDYIESLAKLPWL